MAVVVPFIGAAIGAAAIPAGILGVSGAAIGYFAGSLLASALFKPPGQQGPRLEDLSIVGTDFGQAIPWVAGSPRLAPQYIWCSKLREIANTQKVGKGGGQKVTTYTYECDVMLMVSENITEGVARDWLNSELVRNGLVRKSGLWSSISVYTGEIDQLPDPTYEGAVGAGNAPAYRGHTTIVIHSLQLGGGKQLPNLEHQIAKTNIFEDDRVRLLLNWNEGSQDDASLYETGGPVDSSGGAIDGGFFVDFRTSTSAFRRYSNTAFNGIDANCPLTYEMILEFEAADAASSAPIGTFAPNSEGLSGAEVPVEIRLSGVSSVLSFTPQGIGAGVFHPLYYSDSQHVIDDYGGVVHVAMTVYPDDTASLWIQGSRKRNRVSYNNTTITSTVASMVLGGGVGGTRDVAYRVTYARITRADVYAGAASFTPPALLDLDPLGLASDVELGTVALNELIEDLMARAGYVDTEFEVDPALESVEVYGYATGNVTSTRAHLETLRPFGMYEASCSDKIYIFPRATEPAGSVAWEDLGASESPGEPSDPFPLQVVNETEIPAQIAVRYRNVAADWNTGTEFSDRIVSSQVSPQVVDMPFGMLPEQAKRVAETMLKDAMAGLGRAVLRVPGRKYAKYEPGEILTTTAPNGTTYRFRILTKRDFIFMLEWELVLDDASALDSPAITYTGYISTDTPVRVAPTTWEVLPIRPVRDVDALSAGPYVAITPEKTGETDEWPGGVFVRARLPEAFEQQFISGDACTMGTCLTTLGGHTAGSGVVQRTGKLRVRVLGELSSADYYDFFTDRTINAAVVGNEPIRFLTAEFIESDGVFKVYDLYNFLRGQLGMESEIEGHGPGERFVLLNNSIRRMVNESTDIDAAQQVKAVTLNLRLDEVVDEEFTDDGIALRPLAPVYMRATEVAGDLDFTWIRRSRLLARWATGGVIAPVGESAESYRVKVFDDPDADPLRTELVSSPAWTYTAANQASDGFTTGDPITVTVQQLSDLVGEGDAVTLETPAP